MMHFERTFCGTQHQVRVRTMRNMQTTRRSTHRAPASLKRTCIRMYASPKMPLSPQTKDKFIYVCKRYSLSPSKEKVSQRCRESSRRQESNAFKSTTKRALCRKEGGKRKHVPHALRRGASVNGHRPKYAVTKPLRSSKYEVHRSRCSKPFPSN